MLKFLYDTIPGRMILKLLIHPNVSKIMGRFCDSKFSKCMIPCFVRKNHICMKEVQNVPYESFNQFFCRRLKEHARSIDDAPDAFVAPCDGLLSTYTIQEETVIPVKASYFRISDLLRSKKLASEYEGGTCLVFRLCVNHYHRYIYLDNGCKSRNIFIPGVLHTVRPIALRKVPVFVENSREYTVLATEHFGKVVQMEVGAMLVGRICNLQESASFSKGQEKGYFEYGGSTIILLVKQGQAEFSKTYFDATRRGQEIPVRLGQRLN